MKIVEIAMATDIHDDKLSPMLTLELMPEQLGVRIVGDDWTGTTSTKERRKLQNRLNQRAYRRRHVVLPKRSKPSKSRRATSPGGHDDGTESIIVHPLATETPFKTVPAEPAFAIASPSGSSQIPPLCSNTSLSSESPIICNMDLAAIRKLIDEYERSAYRNYMLGSPHVGQLLSLVQFNVFRAFLSNNSTIGFTMEWLQGDSISPFWLSGPSRLESTCPASMRPTYLQLTVEHHPWLDLLPWPVMRDNILLALENDWDDTDLCRDLVEFCQEPKELTGFIIWGEPWDPSGWEVTAGFFRKWAWSIRGCPDLLRSTNRWREKRGGKKLFSNTTIERC